MLLSPWSVLPRTTDSKEVAVNQLLVGENPIKNILWKFIILLQVRGKALPEESPPNGIRAAVAREAGNTASRGDRNRLRRRSKLLPFPLFRYLARRAGDIIEPDIPERHCYKTTGSEQSNVRGLVLRWQALG